MDGHGQIYYQSGPGIHDDCVLALALAVHGRDHWGRFAPEAEAIPTQFDENRHPGFDPDLRTRRKPWEKPAAGREHKWTPSKELEPLGW